MNESSKHYSPDPSSRIQDTGPHRVVLDEWISCAPFECSLGIEIIHASQGRAELKMPFAYTYANGAAMLHGGAMSTLADTAAVFALKSLLPVGSHFATTHMEVDFLYPVMQGWVRAKADVVHAGKRTWNANVSLFDDEEHEVMQMQAVFKLAWRQPNLSQDECNAIPGDLISSRTTTD
ncbi:MAG: PaaI family thioesterase [Desulfuromonadaceae bacterium]